MQARSEQVSYFNAFMQARSEQVLYFKLCALQYLCFLDPTPYQAKAFVNDTRFTCNTSEAKCAIVL
jgi:hypothetical protein